MHQTTWNSTVRCSKMQMLDRKSVKMLIVVKKEITIVMIHQISTTVWENKTPFIPIL